MGRAIRLDVASPGAYCHIYVLFKPVYCQANKPHDIYTLFVTINKICVDIKCVKAEQHGYRCFKVCLYPQQNMISEMKELRRQVS